MILLLIFLPAGLPCGRTSAPGSRPSSSGRSCGSRSSAWRRPKRTAAGQCTTSVAMPLAVSPAAEIARPRTRRRLQRRCTGGRSRRGAERAEAAEAPLLAVEDLSVHFGGPQGRRRGLARGARGPDRGSHRSQRRRQDHALQRRQPPAEADRGLRRVRRPGRHQAVDGQHRPPGHGPHLPEPAHLREHDRARERAGRLPPARALGPVGRRSGAAPPAPRGEGLPRAGHAGAGRGGAGRQAPIYPPPACPTGRSAWSRSPGRWPPSRACSSWTSRRPA